MPRIKVHDENSKELTQVSVKLREVLGLKQFELAQLLSTTKTTISTWETVGISSLPNKATPFTALVQLISLVRQCRRFPKFASFEKLKAYIRVTVNGELQTYYSQYVGKYMDEHFFNAMKMTNVYAMLFALQFDKYLESIDVETPENRIVCGGLMTGSSNYLSVESIVSIMDDVAVPEKTAAPKAEVQPVPSAEEDVKPVQPERKSERKLERKQRPETNVVVVSETEVPAKKKRGRKKKVVAQEPELSTVSEGSDEDDKNAMLSVV